MNEEERIDVFLFDLGGVLVEFSGLADVRPLLSVPLEVDEIRRNWLESQAIRQFETGEIEAEEFGERFVREWGLRVTGEQFLQEFDRWNRRLLAGAVELLAELRPRYTLACLSNSNQLHWDANRRNGFLDPFDACFSSHELGLYKPDLAAFETVLRELDVRAERVVFFDDNQVNVDGGNAAGIPSYLVAGVAALRRELVRLGALDATGALAEP